MEVRRLPHEAALRLTGLRCPRDQACLFWCVCCTCRLHAFLLLVSDCFWRVPPTDFLVPFPQTLLLMHMVCSLSEQMYERKIDVEVA